MTNMGSIALLLPLLTVTPRGGQGPPSGIL